MDIAQYLQRIGIPEPVSADEINLSRLQLHHMLSIPFENLSIGWGQPVQLDEASLYEKIISRRRGGFCYELNGLFAWLLEQLGYPVTRCSARVYHPETGTYGQEFDHLTLLVSLTKPFLVDVGFGDSSQKPLQMPDGENEDSGGRYRITAMESQSFRLERLTTEGWLPQYRFSTQPRKMQDFSAMCHYHQTSPASSFTQGPICTLLTHSGRITLTRTELIVTENGKKVIAPIESYEMFLNLLAEHFGIRAALS